MPLDQLPVPDVTLQDSDKATTFKTKINTLAAAMKSAIQAFNTQIAAGNLAENSAVTAGQHKDAAAASAITAGQHKDAAAASAITAGQHKDAAAALVVTAGQHKDAAAGSAAIANAAKLSADQGAGLAQAAALQAILYPDGQLMVHLNIIKAVTRKMTLLLNFADEDYGFYDSAALSFRRVPVTDIITTVRGSGASARHPVGIVTLGSNVLSIVYDPITGERLGALMMRARTNFITWSQSLANWAYTAGASVASTSINSEIVGRTYERVTVVDVAQNARVTGSVIMPLVAGTPFCVTVFIGANSGASNMLCRIGSVRFNFNVATGGLHAALNAAVTLISKVGSEYKFLVNPTISETTATAELLQKTNEGSTSVTNIGELPLGAFFDFAAIQANEGSWPAPYIKTEAAQITRQFDYVSTPVTQYTEGTMFGEFIYPFTVKDGFIFDLGNGSNDHHCRALVNSVSGKVEFQYRTNGQGTSGADTGFTPTAGVPFRIAISFKLGVQKVFINGVVVAVTQYLHVPTISFFAIGIRGGGSSATATTQLICRMAGLSRSAVSDAEGLAWSKL